MSICSCNALHKILIVDDTPAYAFIIECLLENAGITDHLTFDNPKKALEFIKANDQVALVITDFSMPEMNGLDLLRRAREIDVHIHGIIVSAEPDLIPTTGLDYIVLQKGNQLQESLAGYVRKAISCCC